MVGYQSQGCSHLNNDKIPIDFNKNGPAHPVLHSAILLSEY